MQWSITQVALAERNKKFVQQTVARIEKYLGGNKFFGGSRVGSVSWSERARGRSRVGGLSKVNERVTRSK